MRLGVLFSGGKDSAYSMFKAMESNEISCLISIVSKNPESYMFHVPNIHVTKLQAEAIGIPIVQRETEGRKEEELKDLKLAIAEAMEKHRIQGIVTGAIESVYQSSRIKSICEELGIECINPLWKMGQEELLNELVERDFKALISGVFAYSLGRELLGKLIDREIVKELVEKGKKYGLSPAGEGGEIETTVLDAPFFRKRIEILESEIEFKDSAGVFRIKRARLVEK